MLSGREIRQKFLDFFEQKKHKVYESASLIPDDPTMLLTIAGMVPFKPFFMGKKEPPYTKVASCQKCIRTNDLENVGKTARHHTFFEMLGNFSFGDYFKEEAIVWAWEFLTEELKLPKDKLWISVYKSDEESIKIWSDLAKVPLERIVKLGEDDNFWSAGPTGSCGPCSEIHIDLGEDRGCDSPNCGVGCECDRYLEIWNLVFTESNRLEDGSLMPLPKKNIDTGMGLERITAVVQGVESNFETDLVKPIIDKAAKIIGVIYGKSADKDFSLRVIADHLRALTMLISDGVLPSNDGRGYVLRRILRRAARHGKLLGYNETFINDLVEVVVEVMGEAYSDLVDKKDHIKKVVLIEEEKFIKTLDQGIIIANDEIKKLKANNEKIMDASIVFKMYDTYGFPFELTEEICEENSIKLDFAAFKEKMEEQKERARGSREVIKEKIEDEFIENFYKENGATEFIGYNLSESDAKVLYVGEGDKSFDIIFDKTPFYAESGGQVSDTGILESGTFKAKVIDVQKRKDIFIHKVEKLEGELSEGEKLTLKINTARRESISRNHTATHLLQAALKKVVGDHVQQSGSLVTEERLRFDFSHYEALTNAEIKRVEAIVNEEILKSISVDSSVKTMEEAKKIGAMALFGDKYGDRVRLVEVSNFSVELCGGTHVDSVGSIGLFKIVSESGVAAGTRRIEAITGINSINYMRSLEKKLEKIASILKTDTEKLEERAKKIVEELKETLKESENLKLNLASFEMDDALSNPEEIKGVKVILKAFKGKDVKTLREMADNAKDKLKSCIIILGTDNGNAVFLASVTKDLVEKGIKAGDLVREIAKIAGGKGGGRPDFAQAGGKEGNKVPEAIEYAKTLIGEKL